MRWFGQDWGAPVCEGAHMATPVGQVCVGCNTRIHAHDQGVEVDSWRIIETGGLFNVPEYWHIDCFVEEIGGRVHRDIDTDSGRVTMQYVGPGRTTESHSGLDTSIEESGSSNQTLENPLTEASDDCPLSGGDEIVDGEVVDGAGDE